MELSRERSMERTGLLYPMMVIAAIAVIVFSLLGIATVMGWLPQGLVGRAAAATIEQSEIDTARSDVTFDCGECGVIQSIRSLEQS
jgi:hypothetical protein